MRLCFRMPFKKLSGNPAQNRCNPVGCEKKEKMIRDIRIEAVLNGFIVAAGCQRLAYTSVDELIADLGSYLREPEATEKRILKDKGINRKHTFGETPTPENRLVGLQAQQPSEPYPMDETDQPLNRIHT